MIKAAYSDKALVVDILTKAFDDNKSVNFVVKQDCHRIARIRALMSYSFDVCHSFGSIFLSPERHACALVLFPDKQKATLKTIFWDIRLVCMSVGLKKIWKVLKRSALIKKQYPNEPICYLWFGGVDPTFQGQGVAGKWMDDLLSTNVSEGRSLFLETSTIRNLPLYQRNGFEIYRELEISGHTLYLMKRQPRSIALSK